MNNPSAPAPTPIEQDYFDLSAIAANIQQKEPGLWLANDYQDFGFLSSDDSDWASIEQDSFWYEHRVQLFSSFIRHHPPEGLLFELGCGSGVNTVALQRAGYPVVGIEPTERFAMMAKRKGLRNMLLGTLESCEFKPGSLSNICMFDVLEHIPNDATYLSTLRTLMPPGGLLYVAVPAWQWLWSGEDDAADHVQRYRASSLGSKLESAGFEVAFSSYYFLSLVLPILAFRAIPYRLSLRTTRDSDRSRAEHVLPDNLAARLLTAALKWERRFLDRGKRLRFGASCFLVARAV